MNNKVVIIVKVIMVKRENMMDMNLRDNNFDLVIVVQVI